MTILTIDDVQLKRGTAAKILAAGLRPGEPAVALDDPLKPVLYVGDLNGIPREVAGGSVVSATTSYIHTQSMTSSVWEIQHDLGRKPSVSVMDTAGTVYLCNIRHLSDNACTVSLATAMNGTATCN